MTLWQKFMRIITSPEIRTDHFWMSFSPISERVRDSWTWAVEQAVAQSISPITAWAWKAWICPAA
jgi:hypothetical protein